MLKKEKILYANQSMPTDDFDDIQPILDMIIELRVEAEEVENELGEPVENYYASTSIEFGEQ